MKGDKLSERKEPEAEARVEAPGFLVETGDWVLLRGEGEIPRQVASVSADQIRSVSGKTIPKRELLPYVLPYPGDGFVYCSRGEAEQWIAYHRDFPISRDWDLEWDRMFPGCVENDTYKHLYRRRLTKENES